VTGEPSPPDDAVPKLPRGRGLRLSRPELFRIAGLTILLGFLLVTQRPCASAVSSFVNSFGGSGSAAATIPRPGTVDVPASAPPPAAPSAAGAEPGSAGDATRYEHLRPGMTDDEVKAVIERARAKTGSATPR
jgi:hypothetical protein